MRQGMKVMTKPQWWWNRLGEEFDYDEVAVDEFEFDYAELDPPTLLIDMVAPSVDDEWARFVASLADEEPLLATAARGDDLSREWKMEHRKRFCNETGKCSCCPPHDGENALWGNRRPRWQREQVGWLCGDWKLDRKSKAVK